MQSNVNPRGKSLIKCIDLQRKLIERRAFVGVPVSTTHPIRSKKKEAFIIF